MSEKDISKFSPVQLVSLKVADLERELAAARARIEKYEAALGEYADDENWTGLVGRNEDEWRRGGNGYDIAREALGRE